MVAVSGFYLTSTAFHGQFGVSFLNQECIRAAARAGLAQMSEIKRETEFMSAQAVAVEQNIVGNV
ncbi:MAG: hypothetical protein P8X51_14835 [Maritimibacter sp.]|jgi:hypothetical protein